MSDTNLDLLLASCIHDMKNSIIMILDSVDELSTSNNNDETNPRHLANLRYEASRLNNDLMHLLGVFRYEGNNLPVIIDEAEIWDLLNEQYLRNQALIEKYNHEFTLECDEDEIWYCDSGLLGSVINNIIVNTVRYTKSKILVKAEIKQGVLCISVNDDGDGYPENMLMTHFKPQGIDFRNGSTSLGLYFAACVAKLHKKQDQTGYIELTNGGELGGGLFTIYIP